MSFVTVTIAHIPGRQVPNNLYRVSVDTPNLTPTVDPGEYGTIEAVLKAFSWPLKLAFKTAIVEALTNNKPITFSLEKCARP